MTAEEEEAQKQALEAKDAEMKALKKQMDEMIRKEKEIRLKEEAMEAQMHALKEQQKVRDAIREAGPHLGEILNNPMTSGLVPTAIPENETVVCGTSEQENAQVQLRGTGIADDYCTFVNEGNAVTINPNVSIEKEGEETVSSQCMINGKLLTEGQLLQHNDR